MDLTLFARREPTTDPILRAMAPKARRSDVQVYRDADATQPVGRFPWNYSNKPRSKQRRVTLNCARYALQWLAPLSQSAA